MMEKFEGYCQHCEEIHGLACTAEATSAARALIPAVTRELGSQKGRMVGVLLCRDHHGREVILKAYSGTTLLNNLEVGWAPTTRPVHLTEKEEADTFLKLNSLTAAIEEFPVESHQEAWEEARENLATLTRQMQAEREERRNTRKDKREAFPLDKALHEKLRNESYDESVAYRKRRKSARIDVDTKRKLLDEIIGQRLELKNERKRLSVQLQATFMATHSLVNFRGEEKLIEEVSMGDAGLRQGTGECAAPKLLVDAARRGLTPYAIAEVWAGPPQDQPPRKSGHAYGPCAERCIPILGYLMCGMDAAQLPPLHQTVLREGNDWVAANKPGGVLSVPGRGSDKVDSMLSRIRWFYGRGAHSEAAHRLDFETSGVQLFSLDQHANANLQKQFAMRKTEKVYLAWVGGLIPGPGGTIAQPIRQMGRHIRGHEIHEDGKNAETRYEVIDCVDGRTLLALFPKTGRTHQLRVHCASKSGLDAPIVGDSLYGEGIPGDPLYLHAWKLRFRDPANGKMVLVEAPVPTHWPALSPGRTYESIKQ